MTKSALRDDTGRPKEGSDDLAQDVARVRGSVLGVLFGALVWLLATVVVACCRAIG